MHVKEYIAEMAKGTPRILILSGSSSLFGINSEIIEQKTGYRTVNLACHGAFPFEYLAEQAQKFSVPGDVIVMPLEFSKYRSETYNDWFTNQIITWRTDYFKNLPYYRKLKFIYSISPNRVISGILTKLFEGRLPANRKRRRSRNRDQILSHIKRIWETNTHPPRKIYSYTDLNPYGDFNTNYGSRFHESPRYLAKDPKITDCFVRYHERFMVYAKNNGLTVILTWPPTLRNKSFDLKTPQHLSRFLQFENKLKQKGINVSGLITDFHLSRFFFYDARYHLNMAGKEIYSRNLASLLNCILRNEDCQTDMESSLKKVEQQEKFHISRRMVK